MTWDRHTRVRFFGLEHTIRQLRTGSKSRLPVVLVVSNRGCQYLDITNE